MPPCAARAPPSTVATGRARRRRDRKKVMLRFAELILAQREELALTETLDMGKPISDSLAVDVPSTAQLHRSGTPRPSTRSTTRSRPRARMRWR